MRWLALCCAGLWSCTPAEEPGRLGVQRQAATFRGTPDFVGPTNSALGFSLAPCRVQVLATSHVAGAPGVGSALLTRDAGFPSPQMGSLGFAVACEGPANAPRIIAAGASGVREFTDGGWQPVTTRFATALARADSTSLPWLVAELNPATVRFLHPVTHVDVAPALSGDAGFGTALLWAPLGNRFLVSDTSARKVTLYELVADAGASVVGSFSDPAAQDFGRSVAMGDVSARLGIETIVGSVGQVQIYDEGGALVQTLTGTSPTFGTALAVEPSWAPGLDALWVSEPGLDQVHRFVGDAGVIELDSISGSGFGTSLSIDGSGSLAVGAPAYPSPTSAQGAVFIQRVRLAGTHLGEVMECDVNAPCFAAGCQVGTCRGGVFCEGLSSACEMGERCDVSLGVDRCLLADGGVRFDGGLPSLDGGSMPRDGGSGAGDGGALPDGGVDGGGVPLDGGAMEVDAGRPDAGPFDGGVVGRDSGVDDGGEGPAADAGPAAPGFFSTRGCTGTAALPALFASLLLLRRRRSGIAG